MRLPCLTYFSSRGRAELIRMLLADAGVEHDEIAVGPWDPTQLPSDFVALRSSGKLAYGALREQLRASILPRWLGHLEQRLVANDGGHAALADHGLLTSFFQRFGDRPAIAAYRASARRYPPQPFPS